MRGTVGLVAGLVISAGAYGAGPGGPPNDAPEDARTIDSLPFRDELDTTGATVSADERPDCPEDHFGPTIWYRYHSDRDVTVEFAVDEGARYVDVFPVGSCEPATMDVYGSEAVLRQGVEYLIRATVHEGPTVFAVREYVPIDASLEVAPVARLQGEHLVVDVAFTCPRAGVLDHTMEALQPVTGVDPLAASEWGQVVFDCAGEVPVTVELEPDARHSTVGFLPGPVELLWGVHHCVRDDFRWEGWEECGGSHGESIAVAVPAP